MKNSLTKREKEILFLIINEYASQEIASELNLSIRTVETHRKNILKKTGAKTLIGLFKYAIRIGVEKNFAQVSKSDNRLK